MPSTLPKGLPLPVIGAAVKLPLAEPSPGHDVVLPMGTDPTHPSAEAAGARTRDPNTRANADTTRSVGDFLAFIATTLRPDLDLVRPETTPASDSTVTQLRSTATCQKGGPYGMYVPPSCACARHRCAFLIVQLMPS